MAVDPAGAAMQTRRFFISITALALAALALALAAWWAVLVHSPLRLAQLEPSIPLTARFIPRDAPFSLNLLTSFKDLEGYARANASIGKRRQAGAAVGRLRDGAFAAAGIDYQRDLAPWLGHETSLAILQPDGPDGDEGWLLALTSRDAMGARRFLQRFWQERALAGTELQLSDHRGMELISGRAALLGRELQPLATALVNDRLVLVASGRTALEQALDVSQINELNLAHGAQFNDTVQYRPQGAVALLRARSSGIQRWLDIPGDSGVDEVTLGLRPDGHDLRLDGLARTRRALGHLAGMPPPDRLAIPASASLQIQAPASLVSTAGSEQAAGEGWQQLLGRSLERWLREQQSPLAEAVVRTSEGPMLLGLDRRQGWQLGTAGKDLDIAGVNPAMARAGYSPGVLTLGDNSVTVWTRLKAVGRQQTIQSEAGGLALEEGDRIRWLPQLSNLRRNQNKALRRQRKLLERLDLGEAQLWLALDSEGTVGWLGRWTPTGWLGQAAGGALDKHLAGLGLGLEAETDATDVLGIHVLLDLC